MSTTPRSTVGPQVDRGFAQKVATRTPTPFRHGLVGHPLLTLDAIADLAGELPRAFVSAERGDKPLAAGAQANSVMQVADVATHIREIASNSSWFTLLQVQQVDRYKLLVEEIVDGLADVSGLRRDDLRRRMGFLFASSPGAITAAHFDIEHSFCMQLAGNRTLGFGRFASNEEREQHVDDYWNGSYGRFATLPEPTAEFEIGPGDGCYIPPYTPHWITNHDKTSLSMTVTFFNDDNEGESLVQVFNTKVRKVGLNPRQYGQAPARDRAKVRFMKTYAGARRRLGRPDSTGSV